MAEIPDDALLAATEAVLDTPYNCSLNAMVENALRAAAPPHIRNAALEEFARALEAVAHNWREIDGDTAVERVSAEVLRALKEPTP